MLVSEPSLMGYSQMQPICSLPSSLASSFPPLLPPFLPSGHLRTFLLFTHPSGYLLILSSFYPLPLFLLFTLSPSFLFLFSFFSPPHPPLLSSPWFPHPSSLPDSLHQAPAQRESRLLSTSQGLPVPLRRRHTWTLCKAVG